MYSVHTPVLCVHYSPSAYVEKIRFTGTKDLMPPHSHTRGSNTAKLTSEINNNVIARKAFISYGPHIYYIMECITQILQSPAGCLHPVEAANTAALAAKLVTFTRYWSVTLSKLLKAIEKLIIGMHVLMCLWCFRSG